MYGRAKVIVLGLVFSVASVVQAGVAQMEVLLQPQDAGPYAPGSTVRVEVSLQRVNVGDDVDLRMVQLDFAVSSDALDLVLPTTHDLGTGVVSDDIQFWDFSSLSGCAGDPGVCGQDHFIEDDLAGQRPNVVAIAFLGLDPSAVQLTVPGDGSPLLIGMVDVSFGETIVPGKYFLDVRNAVESDPDVGGAEVHFNFDAPLDPWRADLGELGGDALSLTVGDPCGQLASLVPVLSVPACDDTLPRLRNNVMRLTFDAAIAAPLPGEVEVRELLSGGGFGSDLSAGFLFSVEGGTVLRIEEDGTVLNNETWYAILNNGGWCDAADFEVDYVEVIGDVNNTRFNDFADITDIFGSQGAAADDNRFDVNFTGFVDFADITDTFGLNGSFDPGKPDGHGCIP